MAREFVSASTEYLYTAFSGIADVPVSLSAWFRTTENAAERCVLSIADIDTTAYLSLTRYADDLRATSWNGSSGGHGNLADSISINTWYHGLAVFVTDTDRRVYLDGVRGTDSTTDVAVGSFDTVRIGITADSTPFGPWSGYIAEAGIWNVALTDADALVLAAGYRPTFVKPESLQLYVPLVRDNDEDLIGGLSLSANGTPTIADHPPIYYSIPPSYFMASGAAPADLSVDIGMDEAAYQGTGVRVR